ncbi:MAG: RNA 2',3'-cyclic phosphodiesterase, partial [Actinobacteria bacterium]|nr:RNA 2',3'-cyclic phosphodiesterase [Actinomycetota bacterium]
MRSAQLHLTLHFLGDVDDDRRDALKRSLGTVRHVPFTIAIRGTGVFPPAGRPSVLWAGVAESPPLVELHAAVGAAIESAGLAVEH